MPATPLTYRMEKRDQDDVAYLIDINPDHTLRVDMRGKVVCCSCDMPCVATRKSSAMIDRVQKDHRSRQMAGIRVNLDQQLHLQFVAGLSRHGLEYHEPL